VPVLSKSNPERKCAEPDNWQCKNSVGYLAGINNMNQSWCQQYCDGQHDAVRQA
jgi:hypothetical protein